MNRKTKIGLAGSSLAAAAIGLSIALWPDTKPEPQPPITQTVVEPRPSPTQAPDPGPQVDTQTGVAPARPKRKTETAKTDPDVVGDYNASRRWRRLPEVFFGGESYRDYVVPEGHMIAVHGSTMPTNPIPCPFPPCDLVIDGMAATLLVCVREVSGRWELDKSCDFARARHR